MPKENRLLLHIEYWAFHCTDSFSMDWITVKFIGCGVTVFSANTSVFLSNSGQILTFQKPLVLHMCPVMSWSCLGNTTAQFLMLLQQENDCIFETFVLQFAVQKCLYLGGFGSDFEFLKTHMSPHVSCHVLGMSCHVLGMSWACPGHVQVMSEAFDAFFFKKFIIFFFFFAKNIFFLCKIHITPPCSDLFTSIL